MAEQPELELFYSIRYAVDGAIPVREVADGLVGLDGIVRDYLPAVLASLTGADIVQARVALTGFRPGSLVEDFLVNFLFRTDADRERFLATLRE